MVHFILLVKPEKAIAQQIAGVNRKCAYIQNWILYKQNWSCCFIQGCYFNWIMQMKWDALKQICRDQDFTDQKRKTHRECSGYLLICTSDGQIYVPIRLCSSYNTKIICESAVSSEVLCFLEQTSQKIIIILSTDLNSASNNVNLTSSLSCFFDKDLYIPRQIVLLINLIVVDLKEFVFFNRMIQMQLLVLESVPQLQTVVQLIMIRIAKDICLWTSAFTNKDLVTPSKYSALTCATKYQINRHFTPFSNWDKKSQKRFVFFNKGFAVMKLSIYFPLQFDHFQLFNLKYGFKLIKSDQM